ncbi:MAG: hypothetical protein LH702_28355 [Phormidesmis sp. CAN_BIN44]|nr:hypothetical protein [Phormidesmis sp. CAN_BIN44]
MRFLVQMTRECGGMVECLASSFRLLMESIDIATFKNTTTHLFCSDR